MTENPPLAPHKVCEIVETSNIVNKDLVVAAICAWSDERHELRQQCASLHSLNTDRAAKLNAVAGALAAAQRAIGGQRVN